MKTIARIIAWLVIVISIAGILFSAVIITGAWLVNEPLTQELTGILTGLQSGLEVIDTSLERLDVGLSSARQTAQTVQEAVGKLGEQMEQSNPVISVLAKNVNEDLVSKINSARESVLAVRDAVTAFNNALSAVSALPFVNIPALPNDLQNIADRLADVALLVQQLRSLVADVKAGVVETLIDPISKSADQIDQDLGNIQAGLGAFREKIATAQEQIAALLSEIPVWIDILSISITLVFTWVLLAQLGLVFISRGYLKTGYLPWSLPPARREDADLRTPNARGAAAPLNEDASGGPETPFIGNVNEKKEEPE